MILDGAAKAPAATIWLTGQSSFNSKELVNPVRFYGFDTEKHAPELTHYNTEGIVCPKCESILQYHLNTYANLGDYVCLNCDFHRPELDYKLTELTKITNTTSEFVIDGQDYKINVGGLYNIYNALAAVSVAEFFGVAPEQIKAGFDKSRAVFGRQETFKLVINHVLSYWLRIQLELAKLWIWLNLQTIHLACQSFLMPTMLMVLTPAGFGMPTWKHSRYGYSWN